MSRSRCNANIYINITTGLKDFDGMGLNYSFGVRVSHFLWARASNMSLK